MNEDAGQRPPEQWVVTITVAGAIVTIDAPDRETVDMLISALRNAA